MPRTSQLTLERVNAQIAELQKKADALRSKERQDVIQRIQSAIDHYGITTAELSMALSSKTKRSTTAKAAKAAPKLKRTAQKKGVIRFRDSEGNTWTGVGKRPNWYKAAIAAGKSPEDLAAH